MWRAGVCSSVGVWTMVKQFRGNAVVTHGFSGENMRAKRADGGRPELTQSMPQELQDLVLPVLDYLTERLRYLSQPYAVMAIRSPV